MKLNTKDVLLLAALGVGIYLAWKFFNKIKAGVDSAADAIAAPIADAYIAITQPDDVELLGNVKLPNGALVPLSSLNITPADMSFAYLGNRYRIDHREGDTYIAKNVL